MKLHTASAVDPLGLTVHLIKMGSWARTDGSAQAIADLTEHCAALAAPGGATTGSSRKFISRRPLSCRPCWGGTGSGIG